MKEDLQKFMELVKTDEALQKKLEETIKNYDGEQTIEAAFETIIVPAAKEAGFSFTIDEYKQSVQELDLDEMAQVSGGGSDKYKDRQATGGGVGFGGCYEIGGGFGWSLADVGKESNPSDLRGYGCLLIGGGWGVGFCLALGYTGGEVE